jgi:hypothetical protein
MSAFMKALLMVQDLPSGDGGLGSPLVMAPYGVVDWFLSARLVGMGVIWLSRSRGSPKFSTPRFLSCSYIQKYLNISIYF